MKTVSRNPSINREEKSKISKFSYTVFVVARTMKFPDVVIPPSIYQFSRVKWYLVTIGRENFIWFREHW